MIYQNYLLKATRIFLNCKLIKINLPIKFPIPKTNKQKQNKKQKNNNNKTEYLTHSSLSGKIHCIDLNVFITECCPSSINFAQASSCPWTTPSAQCPDLKEDPPPAGLTGLCNLSIISQQVAVMSQFFKSSDCPGLLEKSAHMWTVLDHSS